jgi:predicted CxxxxCH...CXXCH cytochrome family protein
LKRALALSCLVLGCAESPEATSRAPVYQPEVRAVLEARCVACHTGPAAAGGWRAGSFLDAVACGAAEPAADAGATPSLVRALARDDHRILVNDAERATLTAWVQSGARAGRGGVHSPGFGDARAEDFHAAALRSSRWARMLDGTTPDACGRCHDGAPARPRGVTRAMPGATACTACHTAAEGALGCNTCHRVDGTTGAAGTGACVSPAEARARAAHAAHLTPHLRAQGLSCDTCHPSRNTTDMRQGEHGDGVVQVVFDTDRAGPDARYDRTMGTCTVACHNRGGARAQPGWRDTGPLACNACHGAPPRDHPTGPCSSCHAEANADGTALRPGPLHMNGHVDLGDASGDCTACHGRDGTGWPDVAGHTLHRTGPRSRPTACASCHVVPAQVRAPGHLDGVVQVVFSGAATLRGARPTYRNGACADVACHGAGLLTPAPVLRWDAASSAPGCGGCHGIPPPAPHTTERTCASVLCHGAGVAPSQSGLIITEAGRAQHIDGVVQFGRAP